MPSPSTACGYVTPAVFLVSTHSFAADHVDHALVRLGGAAPEGELAWEAADLMRYDATQIAPAPTLDTAMTVTLVGNRSSLVVSSAKQRFMSRDMRWFDAPATAALDVGAVGRDYQIALRGTHKDISFHVPENAGGKQRIRLSAGIVIDAVETAPFEDGMRVTLRENGRDVGTFAGRAIGGLDADGGHYVIIENHGDVRAIIIWS